ncbi:MAG: hypothetical protein HY905_04075 [Deltaproteobacteria bacterium]|nr:hypothetical protein [Deltaproteobacteria bacterium]
MEKPKWGCPECGSTEVTQHVTMDATRSGRFRELNGSWTFDGEDEVDRDSLDLSDEGEFECADCGATFERPARIREEPGVRVTFKVSGDAYEPGEHGIEKDLDIDLNTRFEVVCADQEQVKRLFETLRLFLEGVAGAAQAGTGRKVA